MAAVEHGLPATGVHVLRRQVVQALVGALGVVVMDELADARLQITGKVVVFQQHLVFHRAMPALDLALGHRVVWRPACVAYALVIEPVPEFCRDIRRTVIGQQPRPVMGLRRGESAGFERQAECGSDVPVPRVPAVERRFGNAQVSQRAPDRQG